MGYTHLKWIIVIFYNIYLAYKFLSVSFNRAQEMHFSKNFGKIAITASLSKLCPQKLHESHLLKQVYCMQNFVRFHGIESKIELRQFFLEKTEL